MRDEHDGSKVGTGGTVEDFAVAGKELPPGRFSPDDTAPILGWLMRGCAGCVNLIDAVTKETKPLYPGYLDQLQALSQQLANVYVREAHKRQ